MPSGMTKHENIAKALKARLSELTTRVGEIDSELRKPLSADLEEQATDLENHGICTHCGEDIDPKRLEALPTATRCISCAA